MNWNRILDRELELELIDAAQEKEMRYEDYVSSVIAAYIVDGIPEDVTTIWEATLRNLK